MAETNPVFLSSARLDSLRQRVIQKMDPQASACQALLQRVPVLLERKPQVPETWYVPGYYRDSAGHIRQKAALQDDANSAYQLALAYQLSGDERCAAGAARLARAWVQGPKIMRTEDDSQLCFSYHFPALVFAEDLIRGSAAWREEDQQAFRAFLLEKALGMNTMARENNWGNWGLVLFLAIAASAGRDDLLRQGEERWKEFIDRQIASDGHLPLEVIRNNHIGEHGIWYTHFSLMPQTLAAEILRVNGRDLYEYVSPQGRTLRQAFHWITPWAREPQHFPYFKGNDPKEQSGTDYIGYFEILNPRWPDSDANAMLAAMRPLDPTHSSPCLTLTHGELLAD